MSEVYKKFTSDLYEVVYLVDEDQDGLRLDQFCAQYLTSFSREQIKKKIQAGEVEISNRKPPHKPSVKIYHREKIRIFTPRGTLEDEYWRGKKIELEPPQVIYEDDHYLVVNKPPYMTTHPTGKHLFNCLTVFYEERFHHTIHSIHRLDRETSGIQILGKKPEAAEKMGMLFEKDQIAKCYFLIAHKNNIPDFPLRAHERLGQDDNYVPRLYVHCYAMDSDQGKHAETKYIKLMEDEKYILALAFPITGRQHQIRAHAAFHGFPLLGDKLYNGDPSVFMRFKDEVPTEDDYLKMQISRHALHAIALTYQDPYTSETKLHISELPLDLTHWLTNHFKNFDLQNLVGKMRENITFHLKISS